MESRRNFLKRSVYAAPVIMTLAVRPAFAGRAYTCGTPDGVKDLPKQQVKGNNDNPPWFAFWRD